MNSTETVSLSCSSDVTCPARFTCHYGNCMCDYAMMFNGTHCQHANLYVTIVWSALALFAFACLIRICFNFLKYWCTCFVRAKLNNPILNWTLFSRITFSMNIISTSGVMVWALSNAFLSQSWTTDTLYKKLRYIVGPITITIAGTACVVACLNVSIVWIAMGKSWNWVSRKQQTRSNIVVAIFAFVYLVGKAVLVVLLGHGHSPLTCTYIGVLEGMAGLIIALTFFFGANFIFRSFARMPCDGAWVAAIEQPSMLQIGIRGQVHSENKNGGSAEILWKKQYACATRLINASRFVALHFVCFCCANVVSSASCSHPKLGALNTWHFGVMNNLGLIVCLVNVLFVQVKISDYLLPRKKIRRRRRVCPK